MAGKKSVEEKLRRLEELVSELESGDLALEASLKAFEEGMRLAGQLAEDLEKSRERILKLEKDLGGHRLEPLDEEVEEGDDDA
ncbi:MAG: exodeoxyribonuclease VII small subunit [Candidatus Eisenbacteria bacterium]|nr:exodeoxyribonuclease VII small subunit [Candidatus Eisenbacteria bacterium]